ncbi:hypothetical protein HPB50_020563 [Hyalomma asiaticum]|uniref:Uncharacterized protein n=1 Tax=Hyalomma asiaticum TaxID=266040 RepID=A0ACB7TAQ2_HYAAI|nr:hypothetical protein HPB50_020563 [Hyalomma asiaticum]
MPLTQWTCGEVPQAHQGERKKGVKTNPAKKTTTRQPTHVSSGDDSMRRKDVNSTQAPLSGLAEKRGAAAPPTAHSGQGNQSLSQQQLPKGQSAGNARAGTIKNDKKGEWHE